MTDEEKAEMYANKKHCINCINGANCIEDAIEDRCETYQNCYKNYLDGLAEGKQKWHDLCKNLEDLPKERGEYLILHEDNAGFTHYSIRAFRNGYFECTNTILAWCELPKFEV